MFFKLNNEFVDYVDAQTNYAKWYNEEDLGGNASNKFMS